MKKRGKIAQVWIETVIYTLIGLAIIGTLLAVTTPKINQLKDKAIITQTIESLNNLNQQIQNTLIASGNKRTVSLTIKKGEYVIDSVNNNIYYVMKGTNLLYSQLNQSQKQGDITILTEEMNNRYNIYLILNYSSYNITYQDEDKNRALTSAPAAYNLLIENKGSLTSDSPIQINIEPI